MINDKMKLIQEIEDLSSLIVEELEKISEGKSGKSKRELELIHNELVSMKNDELSVVSYPRVIINSWDYSDVLGQRLIAVAHKYMKNYLARNKVICAKNDDG